MPGSVAKIGTQIEVSVLSKMFALKRSIASSCSDHGEAVVYYTRKVHAFLNILDFVPRIVDGKGRLRPPSEQKDLRFDTKALGCSALCVLNSTLFRWYLSTFSDCRNVNRREVLLFPVDLSALTNASEKQMAQLARDLSTNLKKTSEVREMNFNEEILKVQCIIPKHSKPIIDQIDRELALYYGFTDEELDFIISYDIKYRMGRDGGDNEDE